MANSTTNFDQENINIDPSLLTIKESLEIVSSNIDGLTDNEATKRLSIHGENKIPEERQKSRLEIFANNFKSPLIYALLAAALFAFFLREFIDVIVILSVVLINSVIGYIQEIKAKKDIDALRELSAFFVKVIRDGNIKEINAADLVPGDIVVLEEGVRIPADGRLIEAKGLLINESSLTGESDIISKTDDKLTTKDQITPKNMVFQGTIVTEGNGIFVVLTTGKHTRFGNIAIFAQETETKTPIQKKIELLSKQIGLTVLFICALVMFIGIVGGYDLVEMIQLSVSLAVSAIPEGLPIAVTVVLVLGAKRMAKRNAIVRNMMAVETLGTTTVIATDKTGTLTHNKLKVTNAYADIDFEFEQEIKNQKGYYTYQDKQYSCPSLIRLLTAGAACNDATYDEAKQSFLGEPTDVAVLENATFCGIKKGEYKRINEIPFSSKRRYMAVLINGRESQIIYVKGAPEEVLSRSSHYITAKGERVFITKNKRQELTLKVEEMSQKGMRVIALAEKQPEDSFRKSIHENLTFLGLLGMKDTYRPGIKEAISKCKRAGIRIIMLTGDHLDTASTIAIKLGIIKSHSEAALAQDIFIKEDTTYEKINSVSVFARILPEFKYRIIDFLKQRGEIVAMTGDGVNDVPALRKADIGIAMGISGTDAAKESADIVLADDNFATIVAAIEEGRTIFANLRKTILYLISTSLGEVLTIMGALVLAIPVPITPLQILWINLITDTAATIPLGVEPKEDDHLKVPPRNPKEGIISKLMLRRSVLVGSYMAVVAILLFKNNIGGGLDYARTVTFLFLSISQWFNALNCRSEKKSIFKVNIFSNPYLLIGIGTAIAAQVAVMYIPLFGKVFGFAPVGGYEWLVTIMASLGLIVLVEIDKLSYKLFNGYKIN